MWLFITALYQRKKLKNVDLMRTVVFKDVLHMMSPAGNHPDVCSGPHHGPEPQSGVNNLLWTFCIFLMIRGVLIAAITQNTSHVES